MSKRVAVVLSGCGFLDGAEVNESVLTLLHLHKQKAKPFCFAPNRPQVQVTNHITKNNPSETRNILTESARIARGEIENMEKLNVNDFEALIFPGGFGAALNLCDFASKGPKCSLLPEVEKVILDFYNAQKPMGFICIAPALAAKCLGHKKVKLTIGTDPETASALEALGAQHTACKVDQICVDDFLKVVSTPAYMLGTNPYEVEHGIEKLVKAVLKLT